MLNTLVAARSAGALTNLCSSAADLDKLEALFQERLGSKPLAPQNYNDPVNVATRAVPQFPALYLELASELSAAGRTNAAAECHRKAATLFEQLQTQYAGNPDLLAQLYLSSIQSAVQLGDLDKATAYRQKLLALKPLNARLLNGMAWTLATSANPGLRDGSIAIIYAEQAVAATSRTNAAVLDTLAAANAEAGQFDKAVATEKESIARLTAKKAIDDYTTRLKLYQTNTPYREP